MEKFDFNSEEWKDRLKNKSPEEIAEIVGRYYEEKYGSDRIFTPKRIGILMLLIVLSATIFLLLNVFFSSIAR